MRVLPFLQVTKLALTLLFATLESCFTEILRRTAFLREMVTPLRLFGRSAKMFQTTTTTFESRVVGEKVGTRRGAPLQQKNHAAKITS